MVVRGIKEQKGTLQKLKNLLDDKNRKVQGVFYTNTLFSQRYLCRSHLLVDKVDIKDNEIRLTVATRLERAGLLEIEETLNVLVDHTAGDIPGFIPEEHVISIPEVIGTKQMLFSVDLLLLMREPEVTYQEFTIAGTKFTLVNLHQVLEEPTKDDLGFEQTVSVLFGDVDKLYFFSHFYNKDLTVRDAKLIFDLIIDENITGKAIKGVKLETTSGASSGIFPDNEMISSYTSSNNEYIIGNESSYVRIPFDGLKDYKLSCEPVGKTGAYRLDLVGTKDIIRIYME